MPVQTSSNSGLFMLRWPVSVVTSSAGKCVSNYIRVMVLYNCELLRLFDTS